MTVALTKKRAPINTLILQCGFPLEKEGIILNDRTTAKLAPRPWRRRLLSWRQVIAAAFQNPRGAYRAMVRWSTAQRGDALIRRWRDDIADVPAVADDIPSSNPLWSFFVNRTSGPGILKSQHYFDIYQRHLGRFVGSPVQVVEVGVFGGGSLELWATYFGPQCHVHGIDIRPECRRYTRQNITVHTGDQGDRRFWADFKRTVGPVDILIDDGSHYPEHQIVTLEEMLPYLRPGGVFICEDIRGVENAFAAYAGDLARHLNYVHLTQSGRSETAPFQQSIQSIHFYPSIMVIEKHTMPLNEIRTLVRGTEWPDDSP